MLTSLTDQSDPAPNPQFSRRWIETRSRALALDRLADFELQHGHHLAAERLSLIAQTMRGAK